MIDQQIINRPVDGIDIPAAYVDDKPSTILIVDDEEHICELVAEMLENEGYNIFAISDPKEAVDIIKNNEINAVLTDLVMDEISGVDILRLTKKHHPDAVTILMTGQPTMENVITVLREGAYDYLIKPFTLETLRLAFYRGLAKQKLQRENIQLKELINLHKINEIIGSKIELEEILKTIVETTLNAFECDAGAVLMANGSENILEIKYQKNLPSEFFKPEYLTLENEHLKYPQIQNYALDNSIVEYYNHQGIKSHICQPLMVSGCCRGQVHLMRRDNPKPFGRNSLAELSLVTSKSVTAIENAYLLKNLEDTYIATISALANAIETRDRYTRGHTERVHKAAVAIATEMGWNEERMKALRMGGLLHDIGKIGVPDAILNKPGPLTPQEFEIMKSHPILGAKIVEAIPFLRPALPYILYHHERYDGKGYPHGLAGDEIPIEGRILAVVDTVDAITSDRPYRRGKNIEIAVEELKAHAGTQFDPEIVAICVKILPTLFPSKKELEPVI